MYTTYMNEDGVPIAEAREQFADLINRVAYGGEHIILERRGKPVAAIIPVDDLKLLRELEDGSDHEAIRNALEGGNQ